MKLGGHLEVLGQGQIKNFRPEQLAADPALVALFEGRGWWNSTEKKLKFFNGTEIVTVAEGGSLDDYLRLDGTVAMTGDLLLVSADQSASADNAAVSKGYVAGLLDQKQNTVTGAASTVVDTNLAADVVVVSDASGKLVASAVTTAEVGYLEGVTSNVQTQLDGKQATIGYVPVNKAGDSMEGDLAFQGHSIIGLAKAVAADSPVRLAEVEALVAGLNWQDDVDGIQKDATLVPQLVEGARYIVTNVAALAAEFGTIAGVGDGDIVQYLGGSFVVAYDVSADAKADGTLTWVADAELYSRFLNGSWSEFGGLSSLVPGIGLSKEGNVLTINLGAGIAQLPTDEVGIDVAADSGLALVDGEGNESTATDAKLVIKLDGVSLVRTATGLKIAASGVTAAEIATSALGNGLAGGAGVAVNVVAKVDGGIVVTAEGVAVDNTKLAETFLGRTGDTAADLKVTAAPVGDTDVVRLLELNAVAQTASDASAAMTARFNASEVVYDGTALVQDTHTIVHNLNNAYPQVEVLDATGESIWVDSVKRTDANTVVISVIPAAGIRAVVRGNKN